MPAIMSGFFYCHTSGTAQWIGSTSTALTLKGVKFTLTHEFFGVGWREGRQRYCAYWAKAIFLEYKVPQDEREEST